MKQPGSAPISDESISLLPRAVRAYKFYYYILLGIAALFLVSAGAYFWVRSNEAKDSFSSLDPKLKLSGVMALDTATQLIAAVVDNDVDNTTGIVISEDGGKHFQHYGGPWKTTYNLHHIQHLYIAPDHKSIIALAYDRLYVRKADTDSFITITNLWEDLQLPGFKGAAFSNISDTVFLFTRHNVYALNYKQCDAIGIGFLLGVDEISALKTGMKSNLLSGIGEDEKKQQGAFMDFKITNLHTYPLSDFKNKKSVDPLDNKPPDTTNTPKAVSAQ